MRIRDTELVEIVVCYRGRRRHGRSRTPAVRPRRPASLQGGASALPQPIQQTPIQPTAVAGHSLSDALRGLDLSRSRSAAGRASRIAPSAGTGERARLHHPVPLPATSGRRNHRPGGRRDGAPFARCAQKRTAASSRGGRCDGLGAGRGQYLLRTAHASSWAETAAVEALAEVGGRGGSGSAVPAVADRAPRPVERLREFARSRRSGFRANAHRTGAGRRRIRQRKESYLHPARARGAERHPRQARKENLAHPRSTRADASGFPAAALSPPCSDRKSVQFGETQALGSRAGTFAAHPDASSPAARLEFQFVSPEASLPFLEDVNRARWLLVVFADEDGGGEDRGPQAAFIAYSGLGDVHGADDFVGDAIDFFFFVPG